MDVLQKLIVSLLLRGLSPQSAPQHGLVALCISGFSCLQYVFRPWRRSSENYLQPAGGFLLVLTILSFHLFELRYFEAYRATIVALCGVYTLVTLAVAGRETIFGKTEYQVVFEASALSTSDVSSDYTILDEDTTSVMNQPINITVPQKVPAVTHTTSSYAGWESASVHMCDMDHVLVENTPP